MSETNRVAEGTGAPKPGDEKPLHVRVAEVLTGGKAKPYPQFKDGWCIEFPEDAEGWRSMRTAPRYDTDWAATGPLIERYGFAIEQEMLPGVGLHWLADTYQYVGLLGRTGDTPLVAVCNLILALHAAGKLPEAR